MQMLSDDSFRNAKHELSLLCLNYNTVALVNLTT